MQQAEIPLADLEPNINQILGLANNNGIRNHPIQYTILTVRIKEGVLPKTWNNFPFRIRTLGTSVHNEVTE